MNKKNTGAWAGEERFDAQVLAANRTVLVAFLATWSRPCKVMEPILKEVAAACARKVKVIAVNADDHPALSVLYGIESIPTLLCFVNGEIRERLVGTVSKEAVLRKIRAATGAGPRTQPSPSES